MKLLLCAIALLFVGEVYGHGNIVWPLTWFDAGGRVGMAAGGQCKAGSEDGVASCMWFTNDTWIPGEPTLPEELRTYGDYYGVDYFAHGPWRAPGSAPIYSGCGVAGGNPYGCPEGSPQGDCFGGGFSYGPFAEEYDFKDVQVTEWEQGSIVEAAWGVIANHGGGYSYRLCKVPEEGVHLVTEECFQATPLRFHGDMQWLQYSEDAATRVEFKAMRTDVGTTPAGSQWTRNPIPACKSMDGGWTESDPNACKDGTWFEPPVEGAFGYGETFLAPGDPTLRFSIGDYLEVPADIQTGDYVLSFRWDCEQTTQVWNGCSSIKIVPAEK